MKLMRILPVLGLFLLGACAATIPEDAWQPSSLDELMGGDQVASFDATYIRRADGREIPFTIDIDFRKGEMVTRNQHPEFSYEIFYRKIKKNGSGFCSQRLPSDEGFDNGKWRCLIILRVTIKNGKDVKKVFRIMRGEQLVFDDILRIKN